MTDWIGQDLEEVSRTILLLQSRPKRDKRELDEHVAAAFAKVCDWAAGCVANQMPSRL
jgi:hypothetical protein